MGTSGVPFGWRDIALSPRDNKDTYSISLLADHFIQRILDWDTEVGLLCQSSDSLPAYTWPFRVCLGN
jgi:hypothetical protein